MDAKKEEKKEAKTPYKQDKTPEQVKRECQANHGKRLAFVRNKFMHDAKPVWIDKGA